jgi:GTP cyclohydrolase II
MSDLSFVDCYLDDLGLPGGSALSQQETTTGLTELARAAFPSRWAKGEICAFQSAAAAGEDTISVVALLLGSWHNPDVLVHIHSMCLFGDALGSILCGCGGQLEAALEAMRSAGRGVVLYIDHGEPEAWKSSLRDHLDFPLWQQPAEACKRISFNEYRFCVAILKGLGFRSLRLTRSPEPAQVLLLSNAGIRLHAALALNAVSS